ncbi:unnamed protein product, partial [Symbiodinium necroappetens]
MEKASLPQAEDEVQPMIDESGQAAPSSPPIPDDDHEALTRFAAEHDSSSESDQPKEAEPSEPTAFSLSRHARSSWTRGSDKSQMGAVAADPPTAMSNAPTSDLAKFLKDNAVHEVPAQALALKGLETVEDLAYAYPDLASLDSLLSSLSDEDMNEMGAADALHGVQAARLRRALRAAHGLSHQAQQPSPTPAPEPLPSVQAALLPQASPTSWMENLPPKLSSEAVQDLVSDFKLNYPG